MKVFGSVFFEFLPHETALSQVLTMLQNYVLQSKDLWQQNFIGSKYQSSTYIHVNVNQVFFLISEKTTLIESNLHDSPESPNRISKLNI